MSPKKSLRFWIQRIHELGGQVEAVEQNGHLKIRGRVGERRFLFIVPTTPSHDNLRSRERQLARIVHKGEWR